MLAHARRKVELAVPTLPPLASFDVEQDLTSSARDIEPIQDIASDLPQSGTPPLYHILVQRFFSTQSSSDHSRIITALLNLDGPDMNLVMEIPRLLNATGFVFTTRSTNLQVLRDHTNPVVARLIADDKCYREVRRHAIQIFREHDPSQQAFVPYGLSIYIMKYLLDHNRAISAVALSACATDTEGWQSRPSLTSIHSPPIL
ncbi:MAG: hypothetical protein Q9194_001156 [Teloschistes cf. exilis]